MNKYSKGTRLRVPYLIYYTIVFPPPSSMVDVATDLRMPDDTDLVILQRISYRSSFITFRNPKVKGSNPKRMRTDKNFRFVG